MLSEISSAAYSSEFWRHYNKSANVLNLTSSLNDIFGAGYWTWYLIHYLFHHQHYYYHHFIRSDNLDCMMSTVCSNREIPSVGPTMTSSLFEQAINYTEFKYAYLATYNKSEYSQIALGRIVYDIKTRIEYAINSTDYNNFVLYSGHDTTIMPLLAGILGDNWDRKWASYASMVSIEIYNSSIQGNSDLFRIIYNGVQQQVPGCQKTGLCNISLLLEALSYGQENMPCDLNAVVSDDDYYINFDDNPQYNCPPSSSSPKLSVRDWVGLCIMSAVLGSLIGCSALVFYQRRTKQSDESNFYHIDETRNAISLNQSINNNIVRI